jgi:hypothetical protein
MRVAGTGPGQGTVAEGNNAEGAIMGQYVDVNNAAHGFLRAIDGKITRFNAPGAGTGAGQGTYPMTNNREGAISGFYVDANNVYHGFLRNP